jgi:hypothetical protein
VIVWNGKNRKEPEGKLCWKKQICINNGSLCIVYYLEFGVNDNMLLLSCESEVGRYESEILSHRKWQRNT